MKFFEKLFFNIKKPDMDDNEIILGKKKEEIDSLFEYCISRYDTIDMLFQKAVEDGSKFQSTADDIVVIFKLFILDLFNLTYLIYDKGSTKSLENAMSKINVIPNQKVTKYLSEISDIFKKWKSKKDQIYKSRDEMGGLIKNILKELHDSYGVIKKDKLYTKMDVYKKKIRMRKIILLFSVSAFIICVCGSIYYYYVPQQHRNIKLIGKNELIIDGEIIPIISKPCGFMDGIYVRDSLLSRRKSLSFKGWCGDVIAKQVAESVIVFIDGNFVGMGLPGKKRIDVSKAVAPELLRSGFYFSSTVNKMKINDRSILRAFAVLKDNTASELNYGAYLPYRH